VSDNAKIWTFFLVSAPISAYCIWYLAALLSLEPIWLAKVYKVSTDQVHVDAKPKDCDFMHAPIGDKDCHYKAVVRALNGQGWLVGGDDAPIFSHDAKTGKTIVSDDNGKSWELIDPELVPDPKAKSVVVSWIKVPD
jgi:hypothetical protein